jgi:hypothetical protein
MRHLQFLFWIHLAAPCQFVAMTVLVLELHMRGSLLGVCAASERHLDTGLCALAGVWFPAWTTSCTMLFGIANAQFLLEVFKRPAPETESSKGASGGLWNLEHGGTEAYSVAAIGAQVFLEVSLGLGPWSLIFGICPALLGCWNVLLRGNRFEYVTASKAMA